MRCQPVSFAIRPQKGGPDLLRAGGRAAEHGLPVMEIVLARSVSMLFFAAATVVYQRHDPRGNRRLLLVVRGVCGTLVPPPPARPRRHGAICERGAGGACGNPLPASGARGPL